MGLIKRVSNFLNTLRKLSWIKEQVMTYQSFLVRAKGLIFLTDLISKSSKEWNFPFWIGKSKTKSRVFSALALNLINMTIWKKSHSFLHCRRRQTGYKKMKIKHQNRERRNRQTHLLVNLGKVIKSNMIFNYTDNYCIFSLITNYITHASAE